MEAAAVGPLATVASDSDALAFADVAELIPHRDPFLFIDRVTLVDRPGRTIVCRYDPGGAGPILEGHFPGRPIWPGVLQVEAIGQAGFCLARLLADPSEAGSPDFALTHVLGALFLRPVRPPVELTIVARLFEDGLFTTIVGQCLQGESICCVAAVRGLSRETSK
jgi:3-hydroxyacyl-[acyl-carrier-protein] dehydratase